MFMRTAHNVLSNIDAGSSNVVVRKGVVTSDPVMNDLYNLQHRKSSNSKSQLVLTKKIVMGVSREPFLVSTEPRSRGTEQCHVFFYYL